MNVEKFCPFTFNKPEIEDWYCKKELCSWWIEFEKDGRCSIEVIARNSMMNPDAKGKDAGKE